MKSKETAHVAAGATVDKHLLAVIMKSAVLPELAEIPVTESGVVPVLVIVSVCGAVKRLTFSVPKARVAGEGFVLT